MKMEATYYSESSVDLQRTTQKIEFVTLKVESPSDGYVIVRKSLHSISTYEMMRITEFFVP
jgi:hypothetical protein